MKISSTRTHRHIKPLTIIIGTNVLIGCLPDSAYSESFDSTSTDKILSSADAYMEWSIKYQSLADLVIPIDRSSVHLASLAAWIARARPGDLLSIDEIEAGLHPIAQVKLLEVLSIVSSLEIRVLIQTFSPYIMAHLSTLLVGNLADPDILQKQSECLFLKDYRSFIGFDRVSAYEIDSDEGFVSLFDPEYVVRWDTLSNPSCEIQSKFFQVYDF